MKKNILICTLLIMNCAISRAQEGLTSPFLDSFIKERMETAQFAGVSACILKNGAVRWIGNYGFANIEQGVPVDTTTLFYMAYVTSAFYNLTGQQVAEPVNELKNRGNSRYNLMLQGCRREPVIAASRPATIR